MMKKIILGIVFFIASSCTIFGDFLYYDDSRKTPCGPGTYIYEFIPDKYKGLPIRSELDWDIIPRSHSKSVFAASSSADPDCQTIVRLCYSDVTQETIGDYYLKTDSDGDGIPDDIDLDVIPTAGKYLGRDSNSCKINRNENFVADPINIFNGNLFLSEQDLSFSSPFKGGLTFQRYYNSQNSLDTSMGKGWNHNFDIRLYPEYENSSLLIKITDATGREYYFEDYAEDGIFKSYFLANGSVFQETDGNYTWEKNDGKIFRFDTTGRLISVQDRHGNTRTLTYDETSGLLSAVTDHASGRNLTFYYDENSRIDFIFGPVTKAVPDGIWLSYDYDESGNLVRVTYADDENGSSASGFDYRYEDPNAATLTEAVNNLTGRYDLAGKVISTWTYDDQDRAVTNTHRGDKDAVIDYSQPGQVTVEDAYGVSTVYDISEINGLKKITGKSNEGGCNTCFEGIRETVFDPDTGYPTERRYFNGKIETYQDYDANYNPRTIITSEENESGEINIIRTVYMTYHEILSTPLAIREKSLLSGSNPDLEKETIFDYDDPLDTGDDPAIPNENPTNRIHAKIEKGYTLDSTGAVVPYEYVTSYTHNPQGQILTTDGPLDGDTLIMTYYPNGDLESVTIPLPNTQAGTGTIWFVHDAAGNITQTTDLNGVVATFTHDGRNRELTETKEGKTSSQAFNNAGEPASFTDRSGRKTTLKYDVEGLLEKIINSNGSYLSFLYDVNANKVEESIYTDQAVKTKSQKFNFGNPLINTDLAPGQPWKMILRDQADTRDLDTVYKYEHGRMKTMTTPDGLITEYDYNTRGLVSLVTRMKNGEVQDTTSCRYDAHGNLTEITDAGNHTTTYAYDDMDRVVTTISPDTGTAIHAYDAAGNMVFKNQESKTASFEYDDAGRLADVIYPADATQNVSLHYDQGTFGINRLTGITYPNSATDPSRSFSFGYNAQGFFSQENKTIYNVAYQTGYRYDPDGRIIAVTYPSGRIVSYRLDAAGRPEKIMVSSGTTSQVIADQITYYPLGPLKSVQYGNGRILDATVDLNYQTRYQTILGIQDMEYSRDAMGNVDVIYDYLVPSKDQAFGYDNLYQLTSSTGPSGSISFRYDAVGNRRSKTIGQDTDTYSYVTDTNRIEEITGLSNTVFTYHPNGAIRTKGSMVFEYNQNDRLARVTDNGAEIGEYEYNYFGQRIVKTVNASSIIYHYSPDGSLIAETAMDGVPIREYVYLEGQPIAMMVPGRAAYLSCDLNQDADVDGLDLAGFASSDICALALRFGSVYDADSNIYYYHNNHLGTPILMTDEDGSVVWQADDKPFGSVMLNTALIENNLRYPGQYYDTETGFHYNWHRYYDPDTGRYLTPDPIGLAGGINPFVYANSNSINRIDPWGLFDAGHLNSFSNSLSSTNKSAPDPAGLIQKFKYQKLVDCIHQLNDDLGKCESICDPTKRDYCALKTKYGFKNCLQLIERSMDLDQDGDVDDTDLFWWFFVRSVYNVIAPPGVVMPPGYSKDGPGYTDPGVPDPHKPYKRPMT